MNGFAKFAAGVAAALVLTGGAAHASTWMITYTANPGGTPAAATLNIDAADVLNAVNGFDITGISGDVDGDTITGLILNPSQPFPAYSADGMFIFDNVVWPGATTQISNPGVFFTGASGDEYNLFSDNATTYELYKARTGVGYLANSVGVIAMQETHLQGLQGAIPEPATWAMMIVGFGLVGGVLRRERRLVLETLA